MAKLLTLGGKLVVDSGKLMLLEGSCDTICELGTTEQVDVEFDNNIDDCSTATCEATLRGNTFRCTWNGVLSRWRHFNAITSTTVDVLCAGDKINVTAKIAPLAVSDCFAHTGGGADTATALPQTVANFNVCAGGGFPAGENGNATVTVV